MKVPTISIKILSTSTLLDLLICIWYKLNVFYWFYSPVILVKICYFIRIIYVL